MDVADMDGEEITFEISEDSEFVMDSEGRHVQVINLGDSGVSQEVEVVTIESSPPPILTASASAQRMLLKHPTTTSSMNLQNLLPSGKTAPALLRNSRRLQTVGQQVHYFGGPLTFASNNDVNTKASTSGTIKTEQSNQQQFKTASSRVGGFSSNSQNLQHAVLLDEHGQPTNEVVVLQANESGEYSIVEQSTKESNMAFVNFSNLEEAPEDEDNADQQQDPNFQQQQGQTIIICQGGDQQQFQQLVEDEHGNLIPIETSLQFQTDDGTIYFDDSTYDPSASTTSFFLTDSSSTRSTKSKKKSKKPLQVIIGPDGNPVKKKGQTELKCMEKNCFMTCYNVAELRKHLTISHGLHFDEEVVQFASDKDFKVWRETYERERMVSFIYRGGTKKVAKDQAVTYLVCHRSGHYKPTMSSETQRKRKLKPQGSCKMGGYCTAGIKLMKNIDTGIVKMEICHTHYGHPLDSDAIPHLRVTPTLRKVILTKFKAGLSFTEVLAYIHHNPDRLEGLRLVDRRAVRNIYDTWKHPSRRSRQVQKDIDELADVIETPIICKPINKSEATDISNDECDDDDFEEQDQTQQQTKQMNDDNDGPPVLVPIELTPPFPNKTEARWMRSKKMQPLECPSPPIATTPVSQEIVISNVKGSYGLRPNRKVEVYKQAKLKRTIGSLLEQDEHATNPKKLPKSITNKNTTKKINFKKKIIKVEPEVVDSESETGESPPPPLLAHSARPMVIISEVLEQAIEKLLDHGDSGPTVLLYKPVGRSVKFGETKRELRKNDFCVVLQTPVQRQLLQMFPNILGFDVIEATKASQRHLKLAFLMVLDEYHEPIPIAWLLANSLDSRILLSFFRSLKRECGDLMAKYIMAPRCSDAYKSWCTVFSEKPNSVLNDIEIRRDLKNLVWSEFSTDKGRREVWDVVESLIMERYVENLDISHLDDKFESLLDKLPHSGEFMEKLEKEWLSRAEEWTLHHRIGAVVNIMGASNAFSKLRKFIHFKGTKNLDENFEQILKIGYDKCFLRSKRMFKGDQKFSRYLDKIAEYHVKSRKLSSVCTISPSPGLEDTWIVSVESADNNNSNFTVSYVNSPCGCKLVCKHCKICQHMYVCTCTENAISSIMCEHIHLAHCERNQILDEIEEEMITGDVCLEPDLNSAFGKIETCGTEENPGAVINIEAVLKAAGLFHRSDGLQPDQIVSITDADTHTIIYESNNQTEIQQIDEGQITEGNEEESLID